MNPRGAAAAFAVAVAVTVVGCDPAQSPPGPDPDVGKLDDHCAPIFQPDIVPDYYVDVSPGEWAKLEDEFLHRDARVAAGLDPAPYHPIKFTYQGKEVPNAMIRLRGNWSWTEAVMVDARPKMQFNISFNEIDPKGRFQGLRKILLDMPRSDGTFLRQRLALFYLRSIGIPAQCANNARLFINGDYYGLYTNLERMDKDFLQRNFGKIDDTGDLWESGRIIKTNEESFSWARIDALWAARTPADVDALADVDASVREWAAEVVPPHTDGYYMGRANFYLYDHPTRGFIWLPTDLDGAFDFLAPDTTPLFPACSGRWPGDWDLYILLMKDPTWRQRYVDALAEVRAKYDVDLMQRVLDAWAAQIHDAAAADPMKPFPTDVFVASVQTLRDYFPLRAQYLDAWLACRKSGGPDRDGDGVSFCEDCNDAAADVHPGATDTCDRRDDDCDGVTDPDTCMSPTPPPPLPRSLQPAPPVASSTH